MRLTERGQLTIPKPLRERFGLTPAVELDVMEHPRGLLVVKRTGSRPLDRFRGIAGRGRRTDDVIADLRGREEP